MGDVFDDSLAENRQRSAGVGSEKKDVAVGLGKTPGKEARTKSEKRISAGCKLLSDPSRSWRDRILIEINNVDISLPHEQVRKTRISSSRNSSIRF